MTCRYPLNIVVFLLLQIYFHFSVRETQCCLYLTIIKRVLKHSTLKVNKGAKIRNRYNQVPHLIQDNNGKVTNSQLDTTNESQEVSPFPAGDLKNPYI